MSATLERMTVKSFLDSNGIGTKVRLRDVDAMILEVGGEKMLVAAGPRMGGYSLGALDPSGQLILREESNDSVPQADRVQDYSGVVNNVYSQELCAQAKERGLIDIP